MVAVGNRMKIRVGINSPLDLSGYRHPRWQKTTVGRTVESRSACQEPRRGTLEVVKLKQCKYARSNSGPMIANSFALSMNRGCDLAAEFLDNRTKIG